MSAKFQEGKAYFEPQKAFYNPQSKLVRDLGVLAAKVYRDRHTSLDGAFS